jgi:NAD-dependent dihydropyrimidine dehydrogenase PreA subunit
MLIVKKELCNGDAVCTMVCPVGAPSLEEDGKAFIDMDLCVECYSCKEACPQEAIIEVEDE